MTRTFKYLQQAALKRQKEAGQGAPRGSQGAEQLGIRGRRAKDSTKRMSCGTRSECRERNSLVELCLGKSKHELEPQTKGRWQLCNQDCTGTETRGKAAAGAAARAPLDVKQISTYKGTTAGGRVLDEIRNLACDWGFLWLLLLFSGEIPCEIGVGGLCSVCHFRASATFFRVMQSVLVICVWTHALQTVLHFHTPF